MPPPGFSLSVGEMRLLSLTTLSSGSSGNCLLLSDGSTHLLVDAGISARRIEKSLKTLGIEPRELSGILITHDHSDHVAGLTTFTRHHALPVYASAPAGQQLCYRIAAIEDLLRSFSPGDCFSIGGLEVSSFPTLHDAPGSVGYSVTDGKRRCAVVTDLGIVTAEVLEGAANCDLLVVETNHDPDWLRSGSYPQFLKLRILGDHGHLSNDAGADLACACVSRGARRVVLAHLSQENNSPQRAYDTVKAKLSALGSDALLSVAPRCEPGPVYLV